MDGGHDGGSAGCHVRRAGGAVRDQSAGGLEAPDRAGAGRSGQPAAGCAATAMPAGADAAEGCHGLAAELPRLLGGQLPAARRGAGRAQGDLAGRPAMTGLRVTPRDETDLVLTRTFDAPRAVVYDALTTPALLVRWYGARGWNLVECQVDLRVGGAWRFVSRGPGGESMAQSGVYRELGRPERLVYTEVFDDQSYPGESLITTELTETAGRTTMSSTVRLPSKAARDIVLRYPMERGAGEGFERLAGLLAELTGTTPAGRRTDN